jgi:hypothetical protein
MAENELKTCQFNIGTKLSVYYFERERYGVWVLSVLAIVNDTLHLLL